MQYRRRVGVTLTMIALTVVLSGCELLRGHFAGEGQPEVAGAARPTGPSVPVATNEFEIVKRQADVVGHIQVVQAGPEDTLSSLARLYNLGYDEIIEANPDIDPWVPGEGTRVVLPTRFVLPDAPREGIVLNLATMRLFYYPETRPGAGRRVLTHPIGIGRVGWSTPTGSTTVVSRARNPVWYVPASVRREHKEMGNPLPSMVPPGPDNPLGEYVLQLGMPGYLIHGTNKPYGVSMRVSHGCVRLYPEDIAALFEEVPLGTPVHIVNQPYLAGWRDGTLYLEAHTPLEDDESEAASRFEPVIAAALENGVDESTTVDWELVAEVVQNPRGFPVPISRGSPDVDGVLVSALHVQNTLPVGSNWDGVVVIEETVTEKTPADDDEAVEQDFPAQVYEN